MIPQGVDVSTWTHGPVHLDKNPIFLSTTTTTTEPTTSTSDNSIRAIGCDPGMMLNLKCLRKFFLY